MENINQFLEAMTWLGVPKMAQFQTIDLYEAKNMNQVIDAICKLSCDPWLFEIDAFSRHVVAKGWQGPLLGPKLAEKSERTFRYFGISKSLLIF